MQQRRALTREWYNLHEKIQGQMMTARQWTKWLFTALCAIPWLIIFGAYFEICVARLALSRWPRALTDDPNIAAIETASLFGYAYFPLLGHSNSIGRCIGCVELAKTSERCATPRTSLHSQPACLCCGYSSTATLEMFGIGTSTESQCDRSQLAGSLESAVCTKVQQL